MNPVETADHNSLNCSLPPKALALVFPGQGSQFVGMLGDLISDFPVVRLVLEEVSEKVGYSLSTLMLEGPAAKLHQTELTQVLMLASDVAIYRLLQEVGLKTIRQASSEQEPVVAMMAGHSLGEYAALVCADALDLAAAAGLVARRGALMQANIPFGVGAMAAIVGLEDEQVISLCREASDEVFSVVPANFNAIGQVVVAGHAEAVEKAIQVAEKIGARLAKRLDVSVPCHCPLLLEMAEQFEADLAAAPFKVPTIPVLSNVDLSVYHSVEQMRQLLKQQLFSPVRWVETIQLMQQQGISTVIECGPGKVLSGLVKRIDRRLPAFSIHDKASFLEALKTLELSTEPQNA